MTGRDVVRSRNRRHTRVRPAATRATRPHRGRDCDLFDPMFAPRGSHRRPWRRWGFTATIVIAAILLPTGCSSGSPSTRDPMTSTLSSDSSTLAPDIPAATGGLTSVSDLLAFSGDDDIAIRRAVEELTRRCMAEKGFGYPVQTVEARPLSGSTSIEDAQQYGYHFPEERSGQDDRALALRTMLESPGFAAALNGDATPSNAPPTGSSPATSTVNGGCRTVSVNELGLAGPNGLAALDLTLAQAQNAVATEVDTSPASLALKKAWSLCMRAAGYNYAAPADAFQQFIVEDEPSELERQVAVADKKCVEQTGYRASYDALLAEGVQAWMDGHPDIVSSIDELKAAIVAKALEAIDPAG